MSGEALFCDLPDGRRLAYAEWGDPQGRPVFYCHGFPGSRLEARLGDVAAGRLGIRLVAPDRPGFGRSSPQHRRQLSDWPDDLAVLADRLGLGRFHVLGVSGGGPFALACGQRLGSRIERIGIVCGMGEIDEEEQISGMHPVATFGVNLGRQAPLFAQWGYEHLVAPFLGHFPGTVFRLLGAAASAADREVLEDPAIHAAISASFKEAFRAGGDGPAYELGLFLRRWDIQPEQVRVPVLLWHGEDDRTVPAAMGRRLAERLPDCDARFLPDEGHFSLVVHHMNEMLAALVAAPVS